MVSSTSDTAPANPGSVVSLWRYPVKSMMGEELNAAEITPRGLIGDRVYALVERSSGKVASAKNPRKWGQLFDFRAAFTEPPRTGRAIPPVRITLPNGALVTSEQEDVHHILSTIFGREVRLETRAPEAPGFEEYWPDMDGLAHRDTVTDEAMAIGAPSGTFFDYAVLHVLTTATLDRLRELYPRGRFEVRRFRPNIVIEAVESERGFVENAWIGGSLAIGDEVRLRIIDPCPRCVMTTLPQGDLPKDPGILRTVAQHNRARSATYAPGEVLGAVAGVYASILQGGTIRRGDRVELEDAPLA